MPRLAPRTIALIAGLVLLALLALYVPSCLQKQRSQAAQARVDASQAAAAQDSAKDAIGTVARSGEDQAASEALTADNERAIRAAEGANERVNTDVHTQGLIALCKRAAYRDAPRCAPFKGVPK